jgi:hypothetical protein
MATKGSRPAQPNYPARGGGDGMKTAWQSPAKGHSSGQKAPKSPPAKGDGLKQAWADQTRRPSELTDMAAAKKKVR